MANDKSLSAQRDGMRKVYGALRPARLYDIQIPNKPPMVLPVLEDIPLREIAADMLRQIKAKG